MDRRNFLFNVGTVLATGGAGAVVGDAAALLPVGMGNASSGQTLKAAAARSGKLVAMFTTSHDLQYNQLEAQTIQQEFSMIADGNDLKMDRLRPTPQTYNFSGGDAAVAWAQKAGLTVRGHTLVWHNALPSWFASTVNKANAKQIMTDHISNVVGHFAGKMYAWDVVNEVIHTQEGRPDGLRPKPWLELIGPEYIELAFRTAAAADPKAKLVINENTVEYQAPLHDDRRNALLNLVTKLKRENVPVHAVGLQSHLKPGAPIAKAELQNMLGQMRSLGLEIMITEMDVDDTSLTADSRDNVVAQTYAEYLDVVGKFAHVITFEQLTNDLSLPKRQDGTVPHRNLFDDQGNTMPSYSAVAAVLAKLPR